jgi:hypothetical protein
MAGLIARSQLLPLQSGRRRLLMATESHMASARGTLDQQKSSRPSPSERGTRRMSSPMEERNRKEGKKTGRSKQGPVEKRYGGVLGGTSDYRTCIHESAFWTLAKCRRLVGRQWTDPTQCCFDPARTSMVLFCCPHLMPERIINCPVTENPFVDSWFARSGHGRFHRAFPRNGIWGFSFADRVVGFLSDSVAGPFAEPRSFQTSMTRQGGRGKHKTRG